MILQGLFVYESYKVCFCKVCFMILQGLFFDSTSFTIPIVVFVFLYWAHPVHQDWTTLFVEGWAIFSNYLNFNCVIYWLFFL